jgi:hypothetical protein
MSSRPSHARPLPPHGASSRRGARRNSPETCSKTAPLVKATLALMRTYAIPVFHQPALLHGHAKARDNEESLRALHWITGWRMATDDLIRSAYTSDPLPVQGQCRDGRAPHGCQTNDLKTICRPHKMIAPFILARVEQRHLHLRVWI